MQQRAIDDRLFIIGMWWRILYGLVRIVLGLLMLRVVGTPIIDVLDRLLASELVEKPSELLFKIVNMISGEDPLHITYFLATYFIFWGVIDTVLSYNLLKEKLWAFPVSLVLIGGFILYEAIRFTHTHSLILLWIIFVDIAIYWLIKHEYDKLRHRTETVAVAKE